MSKTHCICNVLLCLEEVIDIYQNACVNKSEYTRSNSLGILWYIKRAYETLSFTCRSSYTSSMWLRLRFDTICLLPFLAELITDSLPLSLKVKEQFQCCFLFSVFTVFSWETCKNWGGYPKDWTLLMLLLSR